MSIVVLMHRVLVLLTGMPALSFPRLKNKRAFPALIGTISVKLGPRISPEHELSMNQSAAIFTASGHLLGS
jgi:hypothetical protein